MDKRKPTPESDEESVSSSDDQSQDNESGEEGDVVDGSHSSADDDGADGFDDDVSSDSEEQQLESADKAADAITSKKKKKIRKLKLTTTQDFNAQLEKRGILYLSRVPPRMGPAKVKTLLSDFGNITRVYLVEEDKTIRKKRRKAGGSGFKRYTEGWVEFESKKDAKLVGETLNMTRVTNHKRSTHYDDLWNVKYLKGFKWSHLTEKVAYERRVREQKLRVEMMEVRRENASYLAQVEAGKKLDYIDERRKKRKEKEGGSPGGAGRGGDGYVQKKRRIRQKKAFEGDRTSTKSAILGSLV
mmetsp:Transcript_19707/g.42396  ORF Transcript_19707/g.42396 Transcript_19707/m.42396 type:complete len:300 (-) Transcript_19707:161-1060(-)